MFRTGECSGAKLPQSVLSGSQRRANSVVCSALVFGCLLHAEEVEEEGMSFLLFLLLLFLRKKKNLKSVILVLDGVQV